MYKPNPGYVEGNMVHGQRTLIGCLLGIIVLSAGAALFLQGNQFSSLPQLPITVIGIIILGGLGLYFLIRGNLGVAVTIVSVLFVAAAVGPLVILGLDAGEGMLPLLFVPLALSGLALTRTQLLLTALGILALFCTAIIYQQLGYSRHLPVEVSRAWVITAQFTASIIIVSLILNRFGQSTNFSLRQSRQREQELTTEIDRRVQVERAYENQQNFSNAIVQSLPGALFVSNRDGFILQTNESIKESLGYSPNELAGKHMTVLLDEHMDPPYEARLQALLELERGAGPMPLKSASGKYVPYYFRVRTFEISGEQHVVSVGFDMSQINEAEQQIQELNIELQEKLSRLAALQEIDVVSSQGSSPKEMMDVILEQVVQKLGVDAAAIQRFDTAHNQLVWESGAGIFSSAASLEHIAVPLGVGITGTVAQLRVPTYVHGEEQLRKQFYNWENIADEGFMFYGAIPLIANGNLEGVLSLFHRTDFEPDEAWIKFVDALSSQAALALSGARLLDSLRFSNRELRETYDRTIEGWARALDLRDEETEGHSRRVTDITLRLAQRMGIPESEMEHIRRGALLHDIGKMGVPDSILLKPGKLTDEEWEVMKAHTTVAHEFLKPIPFLQPALAIPHLHHEKYDGTGYPLGLAGEDIPLPARIFAIVDVYDALTSDRPYRQAWTKEQALAHIKEQEGKHFDPAVVEAFLKLKTGT